MGPEPLMTIDDDQDGPDEGSARSVCGCVDERTGGRSVTVDEGRFTAAAMTATLHRVARHLHLPDGDAKLLRLTNNAVFALSTAGVVVRITRSHQLLERADKVAQLGRWFGSIDAPTIRLAPPWEQPILVDGLTVTVWQYLPAPPSPPTVADLGAVLRWFHRLGSPPFPLPLWDPIGDARKRLADSEGLDQRDRTSLLNLCDQLAPAVDALNQRAGTSLVHGDAHVGNLLRDREGRPVLCDFDATCIGPWQVDLVAVAVGESRFGRAGAHAEHAAAYGYDVTQDPDWPTLRQARELKMVAAAVPLLRSTPGIADEFAVRLRSVLDDDPRACWTPFAELTNRPT